jgi:hypothetical protein
MNLGVGGRLGRAGRQQGRPAGGDGRGGGQAQQAAPGQGEVFPGKGHANGSLRQVVSRRDESEFQWAWERGDAVVPERGTGL